MFWGKLTEIVFCALSFMSLYEIPELLIVIFIFIASQKWRLKIPQRSLSLSCYNSWNSSPFLMCSLASLACLSNHLVPSGFLPSSLLPVSSVCQPVPCPGSLGPSRRASLLWKEWRFSSCSSASGVTEVQRNKVVVEVYQFQPLEGFGAVKLRWFCLVVKPHFLVSK